MDSFPASDPVSVAQPAKSKHDRKPEGAPGKAVAVKFQ